MTRAPTLLIAAACLLLAGCWEFLEPELAEQDAATVLQVNARITERGDFDMSGILVPGLDDDGFVREVLRDTLYVFGMAVPSDSTTPTGARLYRLSARLDPRLLMQPFTIDPPVVSGISAGPRVRWSSPLPLDPDTIRIARGADLLIRLAYDSTGSQPPPQHQWFLELRNNADHFQIGANRAPPGQLLIPGIWVPQSTDSIVRVGFTSFQTAQIFQNDYRGVFGYTVQFDHTVIVR